MYVIPVANSKDCPPLSRNGSLFPFARGLTVWSLRQVPSAHDATDREAAQAEVIRDLPLAEATVDGGAAGARPPLPCRPATSPVPCGISRSDPFGLRPPLLD